MGDDGIAIKVAESIEKDLKTQGINVVIGETDVDYCLDELMECDRAFILDATYYGLEPGSISVNTVENIKLSSGRRLSQHGVNLITFIKMQKTQELQKKIYIIGIEISKVSYSLQLTNQLERKFVDICEKVKKVIGTVNN